MLYGRSLTEPAIGKPSCSEVLSPQGQGCLPVLVYGTGGIAKVCVHRSLQDKGLAQLLVAAAIEDPKVDLMLTAIFERNSRRILGRR